MGPVPTILDFIPKLKEIDGRELVVNVRWNPQCQESRYRPILPILTNSASSNLRLSPYFALQLYEARLADLSGSCNPFIVRRTHVVVIAFAANDRASFANVALQIGSIKEHFLDRVAFVLVATKIDLDREVSTEEGMQLASDNGLAYAETSSKSGKGVTKAIDSAITSILPDRMGTITLEEYPTLVCPCFPAGAC